MTIYEIASDRFREIEETSFSDAGLRERQDLQRLLRSQPEIISPDTLVISEEFSQWQDSYRRIEQLGPSIAEQVGKRILDDRQQRMR